MASVPIQINPGAGAARRDPNAEEGPQTSRSLEDGADNADFWLLCAVVCSGKGLYVGNNTLGDLFCMLHTSDGTVRSRTAVTGMVYSNASPQWPSNGNGNAFVLPVRHSTRRTDLVVTVWDGSESLEEAIPVGKVHVDLQKYMEHPRLGPSGTRDDAPPKFEFPVELVPKLAELNQGPATITLMLERAGEAFEMSSAKDRALNDLLRRLAVARKRDRLKRLMQWDRAYPGHGAAKAQVRGGDYSLVALLTEDSSHSTIEDAASGGVGSLGSAHGSGGFGSEADVANAGAGEEEEEAAAAAVEGEAEHPVEGIMEHLADEQAAGSILATVPVRAQAELLSRLKRSALRDGDLVIQAGTIAQSFFFILSGACKVMADGEEVSMIYSGQFLGEIGVLYGGERIADVAAVGDTELLVLNREDLRLALDMFPGLYGELKRVAEMRVDQFHSKDVWGKDQANVEFRDGSMHEFRNFLQSMAEKIKAFLKQQEKGHGALETHAHAANGLGDADVGAGPRTKLDSSGMDYHLSGSMKKEGRVPPSLDTKLHEKALSTRLKRMEANGAFGDDGGGEYGRPGIRIPAISQSHSRMLSAELAGSPMGASHAMGSLRSAVLPVVGSLEQARRAGKLDALSPQNNGWDEEEEFSEDGEEEDEDEDEDEDSPDTADGSPGKDSQGERSPPSLEGAAAAGAKPKKKKEKGEKKKKVKKPRKAAFCRIRFRKAHDLYTPEELGAAPRRVSRLTISGVSLQNLKEFDINAYFVVEGREVSLLRSDIVRGDRSQQEVFWPDAMTVDLEEARLLPQAKLRICVFQSRKVWSDKVVGSALLSVSEALRRPGVPMQNTYEVVKDKNAANPTATKSSEDLEAGKAEGNGNRGLVQSSSVGNLLSRLRGGTGTGGMVRTMSEMQLDEETLGARARGTVTMTLLATEPIRLPFCLNVPPITAGVQQHSVTDHVGNVVAQLVYLGRSRCVWCTNSDPQAPFDYDYQDAEQGPAAEPCCTACAMKGWSECVALLNKTGDVRLGSVFTDVTTRKHARARVCDQNDAHFASVRAGSTSKPEISVGVRFKIVPTFSELSIKATGSIITGKTCSSSFQVYKKSTETNSEEPSRKRERTEVIADINRGGLKDPATVNVQAGKDAVRSVLLAIGINEACRLRPRAIYDGVTFKDKFDREYEREDEDAIAYPMADGQGLVIGGAAGRPASPGLAGSPTRQL